jgi:hypothetical protein
MAPSTDYFAASQPVDDHFFTDPPHAAFTPNFHIGDDLAYNRRIHTATDGLDFGQFRH